VTQIPLETSKPPETPDAHNGTPPPIGLSRREWIRPIPKRSSTGVRSRSGRRTSTLQGGSSGSGASSSESPESFSPGTPPAPSANGFNAGTGMKVDPTTAPTSHMFDPVSVSNMGMDFGSLGGMSSMSAMGMGVDGLGGAGGLGTGMGVGGGMNGIGVGVDLDPSMYMSAEVLALFNESGGPGDASVTQNGTGGMFSPTMSEFIHSDAGMSPTSPTASIYGPSRSRMTGIVVTP
jgi:hypothetical protein